MASQSMDSELEMREKELRDIEIQAKAAQRTKIPERKFGAGVTREAQQSAYELRQEGRRVLGQVAEKKQEIAVYRAKQAEIRSLEQQQADYQRGFDLAFSNKPGAVFAVGFSESQALKEGYRAGVLAKRGQQSRNEYLSQINKLKSEGITPVYIDNKLVGFEDAVRQQSIGLQEIPNLPQSDLARYEKAGALTRSGQSYNQTDNQVLSKLGIQFQSTKEGVVANYQPLEATRYKPFFGRVEKVIQYPFEKVAKLEEKYLFNQEKDFIFKAGTKPSLGLQIFSFGTLDPKTLRVTGEFASYPVYGARRVEELYFDPMARQEFKELPPLYKALEVGNIGLSLYTGGKLAKQAYNAALKPITLKEFGRAPPETFAETKIFNIQTGGKPITLAEFEVTTISKPIKQFQVPNYIAKLRSLKRFDTRLEKYSLEELKLLAPEGQLKEVSKLKISKSKTEPFLVQDGKIISSARSFRKPGVLSVRASVDELGRTRLTSKEISVLSGRTYPEISASTISKSRTELPKIARKQLEELEKIEGPKGFEIRKIQEPAKGIRDLDKIQKFSPGEIELLKVAKLTNKELKILEPGRRLTRADVLTTQEFVGKVSYENKGALKNIELLKEDIAALDVTYPRFNTPRKIPKIKGQTAVFEISPKDSGSLGNIGTKFSKGDQVLKNKFGKENQKAIQEAIGNVGLDQIKTMKQSPAKEILPQPKTPKGLEVSTASAFAGKGTYEVTEPTGLVPGQLRQAPDMFLKSRPKVEVKPLEAPAVLRVQEGDIKAELKNQAKELEKNQLKDLMKIQTKIQTKTLTKTQQKSQAKTLTKTLQKSAPKALSPAPTGLPGKTGTSKAAKKLPVFPMKIPEGKGGGVIPKGLFKVFGKRQGKFKEIGSGQTLGQAKDLFLKFQKGSLGRSAYVETGGRKLSLKELGLDKEFRQSKINDKVIVQKAKFSLGTKDELREIQAARKIL